MSDEIVDIEPVVQRADAPLNGQSEVPEPAWSDSPRLKFDFSKLILPVSILIAAVLISGAILFANSNRSRNDETGAFVPVKADINVKNVPFLGGEKAKVVVVEFGDYQCPFCKRYFDNTQAALIKEYGNRIKFVWKDYAFLGQESLWSAQAARCANDQGKFWEYHDYLYSHQGAENAGVFSKVNLKKFAAALGLNTQEFNSCLDSDKNLATVQAETKEGSAIGVNGTPATFINGYLVADNAGNSVGAAPFGVFKAIVDRELNK